MTKQEAIDAMKEGEKVTHRTFSSDEYITQVGIMIFTAEGYSVRQEIFWGDRRHNNFQIGWKIVPKTLKEILKENTAFSSIQIEIVKKIINDVLDVAEDRVTDLGLYDIYGSNGNGMSGEVSDEIKKLKEELDLCI